METTKIQDKLICLCSLMLFFNLNAATIGSISFVNEDTHSAITTLSLLSFTDCLRECKHRISCEFILYDRHSNVCYLMRDVLKSSSQHTPHRRLIRSNKRSWEMVLATLNILFLFKGLEYDISSTIL